MWLRGEEHLISQNAFKTQFNLLYVGGEFKFPSMNLKYIFDIEIIEIGLLRELNDIEILLLY